MSNLEFDPEHFVFFALKPEFINRASNAFIMNYQVTKTGEDVVIKDHRGNPKRYKLSKSHRMIRVPKKQIGEVQALRNHPLCEGSPNGNYRLLEGEQVQMDALYREINDDKDAGVVIDAAMLRSQALSKAVKLLEDEDKSEEVALLLNIVSSGRSSYAKILTYAERNPQEFLSVVNSADLDAKGLVAKSIKSGVLKRKGISFFLGDIELGVDADDVLKSIKLDEAKYKALHRKTYVTDITENDGYKEEEKDSKKDSKKEV